MSLITKHVGDRIRMYRKANHFTLQELADRIHKSRATLSKYENGEIALDIDTLFEIAEVLQISINQLTDYSPASQNPVHKPSIYSGMSPFYQAKQLYFYFYDGRYQRLKDGIIHIHQKAEEENYTAELFISTNTPQGKSSQIHYRGKVIYSDMLIRFTFVNQFNALEEDLLYIFNPLEFRDSTNGLLCGISSADLMPCAFKCLVTLTPQVCDETLKKRLLFNKKDMQKWQKMNMLIVDNEV